MEIVIKIAQLLLSLSILVIFHEFGHFAFAKLFKTRVEKFYLFFDPWFSLFKIKRGDTEYGIGWLPLGGYVKISGMIDESMDKEQMKLPPEPWEFRSKPAWQRLLIMLGGVMVNFILAAVIYIGILFTWGEDYIPVENMAYGIAVDSTGEAVGFRDGDKILTIDGVRPEKSTDIMTQIILNDVEKIVEVEREGSTVEVSINVEDVNAIIASRSRIIDTRHLFKIKAFAKNSNAEKAGLLKDDIIVKLNNKEELYYDNYLRYFKNNKNKEIGLSVLRNNDTIDYKVKLSEEGMIGVMGYAYEGIEIAHKDYGFFESFPAGISKGIKMTGDYLKQLKLIANPDTGAYKALGSFGTIGNMFSGQWNWAGFWTITAFLSIILGVMNLLPIPALDGGHVVFVLFEMITGKKPSEKFLEYAQIVGFVLLMLLMVYAIKNDVVNFLF